MGSSRAATLVLCLLLGRSDVSLKAFVVVVSPSLSSRSSNSWSTAFPSSSSGASSVPLQLSPCRRRKHSTTRRFYIDESRKEDSGNINNNGPENSNVNNNHHHHHPASAEHDNSSQSPNRRIHAPFTIPILGPFPGQGPLLVGADLLLNAPTPLQWQALEEAYHIHQSHVKDANSATGIDSAPLVAILDEYTSLANHRDGRYATIAAVVGVSSNDRHKLDMRDSTSFMESLTHLQRPTTPQDGKIRLLGIGRAHIRDLFYQVPTSVQCETDNDGTEEEEEYDDDDYYYDAEYDDEDDEDDDEGCHAPYRSGGTSPNIVMAKFKLLLDGMEHSDGFIWQAGAANKGGGRSRFVSPVHALNEMSSLAAKLNYLHADRIKLVRGIQAAQLRYERSQQQQQRKQQKQQQQQRSQASNRKKEVPPKAPVASVTMSLVDASELSCRADDPTDLDDLCDFDGFGALFAQKEWEATQPAMDQFLAEFAAAATTTSTATLAELSSSAVAGVEELLSTRDDDDSLSVPVPAPMSPQPLELKLASKTNFGMGASASSISTIVASTQAYLEKLAPFYSPARRDTEEHYYEVLSFVAVVALSDYVGPHDLGWALKSRNTSERLQQAYDWMWDHVRLLREDAQTLSERLLECGEECTDLF